MIIHNTILLSLLACLLFTPSVWAEDSNRQDEVAERGSKVMPFALAKTQHQFTPTKTGGIQRVIVRDKHDTEQVALIQQHLQQLAEQFAANDYSGPESIHGPDMPGLAALKAADPEKIQIQYHAEKRGASLRFISHDKNLINAVHSWFNAQVTDHGHDAIDMSHCPHHATMHEHQ